MLPGRPGGYSCGNLVCLAAAPRILPGVRVRVRIRVRVRVRVRLCLSLGLGMGLGLWMTRKIRVLSGYSFFFLGPLSW